MKNKLLKLASFIPAVCMLLTGCGGAAGTNNLSTESVDGTTQSGGDVNLTVWCAEEDAALMDQIISSFKSQYSDTNFTISVSGVAESECKTTLLGDVNQGPDVFTFADDQLATLAAAGVLKPIEESEDIISRNTEASVAAATLGDDLYAYPLTADNGYFLYYNKKYLSDSDVETLDGILNVAASNGKKFSMDWNSGYYLYAFYGNTGLQVGLNDDGISNYCTWNSTDGSITGIDVAQAMMDISSNSGFVNGGDSVLTEGAADDSVIAGVSGVWSAVALKEAWGDNLGAVKLPTYTCNGQQVQMASYAGYKMVGVNSYSSNKDWAAKLADWISNEQNQTLRFNMREQGPSNSKAAASGEVASSVALSAVYQQAEFSSLQRIGAAYWDASARLGQAMATQNTGALPLQDFLDSIVKEITASNS